MNVKISYTVPFEEVPKRVSNLLIENRNTVEEIAEIINQINVSDSNILTALSTIDSLRKKLFKIDTQLGDCYSILAGYNKVLSDVVVAKDQEAQNAVNVESDNQDR